MSTWKRSAKDPERSGLPPREGRDEAGVTPWRERLFVIIFRADTPGGKLFDLLLIVAIVASVLAVMLTSVHTVVAAHGRLLYYAEWFFTGLFTVEYVLRLYCVRRPGVYARSFFGIVDLLSIAPTYLELVFTGATYVLVVRILRILRLFRVLKLSRYVGEADALVRALRASRRKIIVFIYGVATLVVLFGSLMYLVEGEANGFTSIPRGIYWSIVTLTTVGYGDITPHTPLGQAISSVVMILGYGIIAVPTGIYAAELSLVMRQQRASAARCPRCETDGHDEDARYCKQCGSPLGPEPPQPPSAAQ